MHAKFAFSCKCHECGIFFSSLVIHPRRKLSTCKDHGQHLLRAAVKIKKKKIGDPQCSLNLCSNRARQNTIQNGGHLQYQGNVTLKEKKKLS